MSRRGVTRRAHGPWALLPLLAGASLSFAACHDAGPTLTAALPSRLSARGGESLTLRGSGFDADTTVRLGDDPAAQVKVVSEEEIRLTTGPLFAGPLSVTVETGQGKRAELAGGLEVLPLDLRFVEAPPYAFPSDAMGSIVGAALGDFDHDGDPDLVTCAAGAPCRLLRNDGRGNFSEALPGNAGPRFPEGMPDTRVVAAADFDGDGALDLFVGLGAEGPGVIYQNDGSATFTEVPPGALPANADPVTAVAVADLDGDGLPDLVIANAAPDSVPVRVYRNTTRHGAITFKAAAKGTVPVRDWAVSALALVDVDGDGALDLVLATPGAADGIGLRLLLGTKDGFREAVDRLPNGAAPSAFAAGDVNGDGAVDLVAVGAGQDRLLLNDGAGHFFDATLSAMPLDAAAGTSVALVDLDRDRHLDLVIGNAGAATRLYLNDGAGRFFDHTPLLPIRTDATVWVGAADVDGDAAQDLLILNASPDPARLYVSVEPDDAR